MTYKRLLIILIVIWLGREVVQQQERNSLILQIQCLVDAALPQCKARREFNINWKVYGINQAFLIWRRDNVIQNEHFIQMMMPLMAKAEAENIRPN